ncbi:hypothetical protein H5410_049893 [Solanum commersonii]|uniref:Uncharacterized protein n=1 Tax=Solanum commersonii TaxID=4109 RepID=A0A9J5WU38_SOLCO|nr:hypothetical protein H5410_049893 [Solanum commersonii]
METNGRRKKAHLTCLDSQQAPADFGLVPLSELLANWRQLWSRINLWLQRPIIQFATWEQHMEWVIKNAKGRTMRAQAFKIVYTECVYAIWLEWNQRVFEKKPEIMRVIAREIASMCSVRAQFLRNLLF